MAAYDFEPPTQQWVGYNVQLIKLFNYPSSISEYTNSIVLVLESRRWSVFFNNLFHRWNWIWLDFWFHTVLFIRRRSPKTKVPWTLKEKELQALDSDLKYFRLGWEEKNIAGKGFYTLETLGLKKRWKWLVLRVWMWTVNWCPGSSYKRRRDHPKHGDGLSN